LGANGENEGETEGETGKGCIHEDFDVSDDMVEDCSSSELISVIERLKSIMTIHRMQNDGRNEEKSS